jgi:hypothetical protein
MTYPGRNAILQSAGIANNHLNSAIEESSQFDSLKENHSKETSGEVTYVYDGFDRNGSSNFTYIVNGSKHMGYDERHNKLIVGQKFVVNVFNKDGSGGYLKIENPIFYLQDTITVQIATIIAVNKWSVSYSYRFGDKSYLGFLNQKNWINILSNGQQMICLVDVNSPKISILIPDEKIEGNQSHSKKIGIGDTCLFLNWLERASQNSTYDSTLTAETNYIQPGLYYYSPDDLVLLKKPSTLLEKINNVFCEHIKLAQINGVETFRITTMNPTFESKHGTKYTVNLNKLSNSYKLIYFNGIDSPRAINMLTETNSYAILRNMQ